MVESKGEIRILKQLLLTDGLSLSQIQEKCHLSWRDLKRLLLNLQKEGLVLIHEYSATTIVTINKDSPKYRAVKTLWGEQKID